MSHTRRHISEAVQPRAAPLHLVKHAANTSPEAELLEDAEEDLLAFTGLRQPHWSKLRSTNPLERVNHEVGHRTDAVGILPNDRAAIRLAGQPADRTKRRAARRSPLPVGRAARARPRRRARTRARGATRTPAGLSRHRLSATSEGVTPHQPT